MSGLIVFLALVASTAAIRPEPTFPADRITPGERGVSTVAITVVGDKEFAPAINSLLEILVVKNLLDLPTANRILVTFGVAGRGRFSPNGAPKLTQETIAALNNLDEEDKARERFTSDLNALLFDFSKNELVRTLLSFLIDTGVINLPTAQRFLIAFRITGTLSFKTAPQIQEPLIVPGQDPGPNTELISTVKIITIDRDLPPLIKRLLELSVKSKLFTRQTADDILVTLGFKAPGGKPLTEASKLEVNGKAGAKQKFIASLTPLLRGTKSLENQVELVKALTEFLVDNAVMNNNSGVRFLFTYGVTCTISVKQRQMQLGTFQNGKAVFGDAIDVNGQLAQLLKQAGAGKLLTDCGDKCRQKIEIVEGANLDDLRLGQAVKA